MKNKKNNIKEKSKKIKSKPKTKKRISKIKIDRNNLIILLFLVILLILSFIFLGFKTSLILLLGNTIIYALTILSNKMRKKKKAKKILTILSVTFLSLCIIGSLAIACFFLYIVKTAPTFDPDLLNKEESSLIYDCNNNLVAELGAQKREKITTDEVSEIFIDALVAIEDSRFYQHNGVDAARFIKAAFLQLLGKDEAGGASTLSMQMIKLTYTGTTSSGIKGIIRKFTDVYMSVFNLEKTFTKNEILEFYINNNYLGSQAYGIEQAAKTYFGKKASELNIAEAATLAGVFQSPTTKNPFSDVEAATTRRNQVLNMMYRHGYITAEERDLAKSISIESLLTENQTSTSVYQAYINTVVEESIKKYNANPYTTPMIIYTNMDSTKQANLDKIFTGETFQWENEVVQAGIAAVDVHTGKIIAIGAGRNKNGARDYNFATMINKQIGSTAKPIFDYGPGIEYNNWSTYTQFNDEKYYYSSGQEMRNADRQYMGWISIRTALAQSRNVPALKAFQQVDNKKIIEFVTKMGLTPEISNGLIHEAHSVGSYNGSNPLEMAAAYATFANGGIYYEPYTINKVIFRNTNETIEYESEGTRVMSEATAFMITDCLVTTVQSGLASSAKIWGINIAAKTGTTNYSEQTMKDKNFPDGTINDSWIIGYSPDISIGIWYGYDKIYTDYYSTVYTGAAQKGKLFRAAGSVIFDRNGKNFTVPASVTKVAIEKDSPGEGLLPSEYTPDTEITYEYYKKGTEPTEVSPKYIPLEQVENISITYDLTTFTTTITWDKVAEKDLSSIRTENFGDFGYKIYKNGVLLGFTTKKSLTITDDSSPYGQYKIITAYEKFEGNQSEAVIYNFIDPSAYNVTLNVEPTSTITIASSTTSQNPTSGLTPPSTSDITAYQNNIDVTSSVNITITIKNKAGTIVDDIQLIANEEYLITYTVTYPDTSTTVVKTRTIKIN